MPQQRDTTTRKPQRDTTAPSFAPTPTFQLSPDTARTPVPRGARSGSRSTGRSPNARAADGPSPRQQQRYGIDSSAAFTSAARTANNSRYHDGVPISPTEDKSGHGEVGLQHTVHAAHTKELDAPLRHKTYLICTYTADLSQEDVDQPWFVTSSESRDQQDARQTLGLRFPPDNRVERADVWRGLGQPDRRGALPGSSSRTDAHVGIRLHGSRGESGWRTLAQEGEGISEMAGNVDVFSPGGVDEFAITCTDLGDLQTIEVRQGGDGHDQNTSLWKVGRIAITTTQHRATDKITGQSVKTINNPHWIFVPKSGEEWLGRFPSAAHPLTLKIAAAHAEIEELERQIREKREQIYGWEQEITADDDRARAAAGQGHTLSMHIEGNALQQALGGLPGAGARAAARAAASGKPAKPQPEGFSCKRTAEKARSFCRGMCGSKPADDDGGGPASNQKRRPSSGAVLAPKADKHLSLDGKRVIDNSIGGTSTSMLLTPQKSQPEPEPEPQTSQP